MERFAEIFDGLKRAHGCTYINTKPTNGEKLKTKSLTLIFEKSAFLISLLRVDFVPNLSKSGEPGGT